MTGSHANDICPRLCARWAFPPADVETSRTSPTALWSCARCIPSAHIQTSVTELDWTIGQRRLPTVPCRAGPQLRRSGAPRATLQMRASPRNVAQAFARTAALGRTPHCDSFRRQRYRPCGTWAWAPFMYAGLSVCTYLTSLFAGLVPISASCVWNLRHPHAGVGFCFRRCAPSRRALKRCCQPDAELVISLAILPDCTPPRSPRSKPRLPRRPSIGRMRPSGPIPSRSFSFTSGSTGTPKGVINTQRMLCSNQQMVRTMLPFVVDDPPVLCDWLPWNHTFAGNHDFGLVLYNGGSYYIDDGRPVAGKAIEATGSAISTMSGPISS